MSETKKEIRNQLKYMKSKKIAYLKNISLEEYNKRIKSLKDSLK